MQRGVDGEQNALHKTNIGQSLRYQLTSQYGGCIVVIPPGHVEIAVNSLWLLHEFARKLGMPKSLVNKFSILYIYINTCFSLLNCHGRGNFPIFRHTHIIFMLAFS